MNALVHHPLVILQTIWETISYMMTRGIQSAIILTGTKAVGTLLIITINAGLLLCSLSCLGSIKLMLFY